MKDYIQLAKPRITLFVVLTAWIGYWLAGGRDNPLLVWTLLGVGLASTASGTLNQWLESEADGRMKRTSTRPIPGGRLTSGEALTFGLASAALGLLILFEKTNLLTFGLTAFTIASYVLAYTPLKKITPQSTWIGAVSGAMPPLIGWAAARGSLGPGAWALFAIQFLWQIPHFLAIFWLYREDYARAGFKVMPVIDPSGRATGIQIALHSFALLVASMLPLAFGLAGLRYGFGALILGTGFLVLSLRSSWTMANVDARRLFLGSLAYLPALLGLLVFVR